MLNTLCSTGLCKMLLKETKNDDKQPCFVSLSVLVSCSFVGGMKVGGGLYLSVPRGPLSHDLTMEIWHPSREKNTFMPSLSLAGKTSSLIALTTTTYHWCNHENAIRQLWYCNHEKKHPLLQLKPSVWFRRNNLPEFAGWFSHTAETGSPPPTPSLTLSINWIHSKLQRESNN